MSVAEQVALSWVRLPAETEVEFAWFRAWLTDAGAPLSRKVKPRGKAAPPPVYSLRSHERTAAYLGMPVTAVKALAFARQWEQRARLYDDSLLAREMGARLESHDEYREREAKLLGRGLRLIDRALDAVERDLDDDTSAKDARVRYDLSKLIGELLHYSRLAHGQSTANDNVNLGTFGADLDWSVFTETELAELTRLIEKGTRAEDRK